MATPIVMPQQGNTVESCLILEWQKEPGEKIAQGEVLCVVETDKATFEVESPAAGTLLARFFQEGEDVPVLTNIAAVGEEGEDVSGLKPEAKPAAAAEPAVAAEQAQAAAAPAAPPEQRPVRDTASAPPAGPRPISPRARRLARERAVPTEGLTGSGPGGRIIERDVRAAFDQGEPLTPAARAALRERGGAPPVRGSGIGGRITVEDVRSRSRVPAGAPGEAAAAAAPGAVTEVPVSGIRKLIAERMLASLQSTAQLTLNAAADARALLDYRRRLKAQGEDSPLASITINHLLLFAVSRVLPIFPECNALLQDEVIRRYEDVHLAFAVDTPRGLMVPVIRCAHSLSLRDLAEEARRLSTACLEGNVNPDELQGGTFTVTNLGQLGVESFTPILNPPQAAILGVGNIQPKPVAEGEDVVFRPHIGLSLTIDHRAVDGAPGARFLNALCSGLGEFPLLLAR